jgi:hypothetical protein
MMISVVNASDGALDDAAVQKAIRAVNLQIEHDFAPHWSLPGRLRLEGRIGRRGARRDLGELRGDAILYLLRSATAAGGEHDLHPRGVPFGVVYLDLAAGLEDDWRTTLSHEALELLADPLSNLLVQGPHPAELAARKPRQVFHWYEVCDAVQSEHYRIDGVPVSNFVLPHYFTRSDEPGMRNDFLGTPTRKGGLRSFGVNPGGYVGFWDPELGKHSDHVGDARGKRRLARKRKAGVGRGVLRRSAG